MKQSNNRSLISVLMPVRNSAGFLVEAIESIRSQTYKNWELIVVDDASKDGSEIILQEYQKIDPRIKVLVNKKRKGIGYSLNRALRQAQGEFIARMDADDISMPTRFEKQLAILQKNPHLIACGGQTAIIDSHARFLAYKKFPTDSDDLYKMIMKVVPIQHPILMAKSNVFKSYRYDESLPTAEDVDMLFFLLSKGPISNVNALVYLYRKTDTSNGYHNIKQTFLITFASRFKAIGKYGYIPTFSGILTTLAQYAVVSLLPQKAVLKLFEMIRFEKLSPQSTYLQ